MPKPEFYVTRQKPPLKSANYKQICCNYPQTANYPAFTVYNHWKIYSLREVRSHFPWVPYPHGGWTPIPLRLNRRCCSLASRFPGTVLWPKLVPRSGFGYIENYEVNEYEKMNLLIPKKCNRFFEYLQFTIRWIVSCFLLWCKQNSSTSLALQWKAPPKLHCSKIAEFEKLFSIGQ